MKKLFVLLAVIGILASCSKEAPVLPATDKVQGTTSAHSGNKADRITIGMDMSGVLEEVEQVIGSLDAPQEARGISTPINTAANGRRLIDDTPEFKEKVLHALGIIYDKKTGATVDVIMHFKSNGNNGLIFRGKVELTDDAPTAKAAWEALEASKMQDAYISIYIGVDGTGTQLKHQFTNKGAFLIKNGDDGDKLPKNFVVLKSLENKLDWEEGSEYPVIIKDRKIAKFSLQGYLLGIRFRNAFPKQMVKHTWRDWRAPILPATPYKLLDRPDLQLKLRVRGLSVTTSSDIHYDPTKGAVVFTKTSVPTTGFTSYGGGYSAVSLQTLDNQGKPILKSDVISVPADPSREKNSLSANEEFILLYCPIPLDQGEIAFEAVDDLFYDGSDFSTYKANPSAPKRYYNLNKINNVITKVKGQGTAGPAARRAMPTDNKIFLQMFDIDPGAGDVSASPFATSRARVYIDYSQRLRELFPGEGYR